MYFLSLQMIEYFQLNIEYLRYTSHFKITALEWLRNTRRTRSPSAGAAGAPALRKQYQRIFNIQFSIFNIVLERLPARLARPPQSAYAWERDSQQRWRAGSGSPKLLIVIGYSLFVGAAFSRENDSNNK